jgi:hypothetical protein
MSHLQLLFVIVVNIARQLPLLFADSHKFRAMHFEAGGCHVERLTAILIVVRLTATKSCVHFPKKISSISPILLNLYLRKIYSERTIDVISFDGGHRQ